MKRVLIMLNIILNKNEEKEKIEGFPWIFNNEINSFEGHIVNGEVVKVLTFAHNFLCYGFLNTNSKAFAVGPDADKLAKIFDTEFDSDGCIFLEGVVSRKKQIAPVILKNA